METINRNNYEEYFLLYIDKELSSDTYKLVDEFILKNPDLAQEFHSLIDTKLHPSHTILFEDKNALKKHGTFIHTGNYQEISLLYIDKELSSEENQFVENFYQEQPALLPELMALQKTILPEEHIVFKDKKSLYKYEGKVFFIAWKKWAAAAAVLIFILAAWWYYPGTKNAPLTAKSDQVHPSSVVPQNPQTQVKSHLAENIPETDKKNQLLKKEWKGPGQIQKKDLPENQSTAIQVAQHISPNQSIITNTKNDGSDLFSERERLLNEKETVADNKNYAITSVHYDEAPNTFQVASYKVINTSPEEDNSLAIGTISLNKEKINGLLKKAGSLFRKKPATETNEKDVKVANLKINYN
ncbi:MAG: hypothetical protein JSS67_01820 [Bacteroidetes bacterium]|nr:hypothetical protein [Bacteroidota bacterium]